MLVHTEGIVIRTRDYGEAGKIVTFFTPDHGKLAAVARGAKKPKSRLSAVTQPFTLGRYLFFLGSGLATLSQGEITNSHHSLRADLLLAAYSAYLVELLDRMTVEKEPAPSLFRLLSLTLEYLEKGVNPEILSRIFELRVLASAGLKPVLDRCTVCSSKKYPFHFSVRQGGFICIHCLDQDPNYLSLDPATARILQLLARIDPARLGEVKVKSKTERQLEQALRLFIDEYADIPMKSRSFLQQLRRDGFTH